MQTMIKWKEKGGGGGNWKQRGKNKLAPLHLIQKMHVNATSHQISSNYYALIMI